jgi:predicted regulator of Ras-like GTPase activity (Roadblock/LC7/MglB family)
MNINSRDIIWISLFSLIIIFIPMFYFPSRFGLSLATSSYTYSLFEIFFYGVVFYAMRPRSSLVQLLAGAGLTFLYRILLGTVFGVLLYLFYGMELTISLALGVSRYLPGILLHVILAPFLMRSVFMALVTQGAPRKAARSVSIKPAGHRPETGHERMTSQPSVRAETSPPAKYERPSADEKSMFSSQFVGQEVNGFERAVSYIGEHQAVRLAAIVDHEGLLLAKFSRHDTDPEAWGSYARLIQTVNQHLIRRFQKDDTLDDMEMSFGGKRLSIDRAGKFSLMVLANKEDNDLLNIRIAQSVDIIKKYSEERYGKLLSAGTEVQYVSDTGRTE